MCNSPTRILLIGLVTGAGLHMLAGCQTWSGFGFGNPSRVPPPGTGTYQPSVGYYDNSAVDSSSAASGVVTPAAVADLASANSTMPQTNLPQTNLPQTNLSQNSMAQGSIPQTNQLGQPYDAVQAASFDLPRSDQPANQMPSANQIPSNGLQSNSMPSTPTQLNPATGSINDTGVSEPPSLRWQQ